MQRYPVLGEVVVINGQLYVTVKIKDGAVYYFMEETVVKSSLGFQEVNKENCYIVDLFKGIEEPLFEICESKKYEIVEKVGFCARRMS